MRHRTASVSSSASSASSAATPQRFRQQYARRSASERRHGHHYQHAIVGGVGKLFRLVIVALILALIVPFVRTYLFGTSTSVAAAQNATNSPRKTPLHKPVQQDDSTTQADRAKAHEVDVFNFHHQDYIQSARNKANTKAVIASASPTAIIPNPQPSTSTFTNRNHANQNQHHAHQPTSNLRSTLLSILTTLFQLGYTLVGYLVLPLWQLLRIAGWICGSIYHSMRVGLSHMLRPVLFALAPLSYLVRGVLFVFILTPGHLLSRTMTELYPVYIFLGVATVVGLTMGIGAAAVLYLSAYLFVDRVPPQIPARTIGMVRQDSDSDTGHSTPPLTRAKAKRTQHSLHGNYLHPFVDTPPSQGPRTTTTPATSYFASTPSPLDSPTSPYRTATSSRPGAGVGAGADPKSTPPFPHHASAAGSALHASVT